MATAHPHSALEPASPPLPVRAPADRAPAEPPARRDVALDLIRGLAMAILVINHVHLETPLEHATRALLSAAEVLVGVSGVVVGMVFGRRWVIRGARATSLALLRRARTLYVASVIVVALVGALQLLPGAATEVLSVSPRVPDRDLYDFDGPVRMGLAILTLEAGPWQFNILGFFIAALAVAPVVLFAVGRGWWPVVLVASWALYLAGRAWTFDVLPSQSERPFPFLVWQLLFVHGLVLGWHRERVARAVRRAPRAVAGTILGVALVTGWLRLHALGVDPLSLDARLGLSDADWAGWREAHYRKTSLDPLRLLTLVALTLALYLGLTRFEALARRTAGRLLLPLGRNSFYVFIVHVFLCLALASVPPLAGPGPGGAAGIAVQAAALGLLWLMVSRRVLFGWIPR